MFLKKPTNILLNPQTAVISIIYFLCKKNTPYSTFTIILPYNHMLMSAYYLLIMK